MNTDQKTFEVAGERFAHALLQQLSHEQPELLLQLQSTLNAGGFLKLQTAFAGGRVIESSLWLSGPLHGAVELWSSTQTETRTTPPEITDFDTSLREGDAGR